MECPSKKQYYVSEFAVATAAVFYEGQRPEKLYWYQCEHCHGFHLTSNDHNRHEDYYNLLKLEVIKKNTIKEETTSKLTYKEIKELRKVVVENNNYDEILEWNQKYPGQIVVKIKKSRKEIEKIRQMRQIVEQNRDYNEYVNWNKEHPDSPLSMKRFRHHMKVICDNCQTINEVPPKRSTYQINGSIYYHQTCKFCNLQALPISVNDHEALRNGNTVELKNFLES